MQVRIGQLVRSKQGRDINRVYVVSEVNDSEIFVVDGKYHTVEKPKKKNAKHLQPINKFMDFARNDVIIKRFIKLYEESLKEE